MPRHLPAPVIVTVVFRYVVHIVKDETVPVQVLHCFPKANVEEHGTVEGLVSSLGGRKLLLKEGPVQFELHICVLKSCLENCRGQPAPTLVPHREMMYWNRQTGDINQDLNMQFTVQE